MKGKIDNPAKYRLEGRGIVLAIFYALVIVLEISGLKYHLTGVWVYLLATLFAFPIAWLVVVFGLYLAEEKDEFQRNVQVQSLLWGIGATLILAAFWGSLEGFAQVRHLNIWWVAPSFLFFKSISQLPVKLRYR
jgi:hypothetical protein